MTGKSIALAVLAFSADWAALAQAPSGASFEELDMTVAVASLYGGNPQALHVGAASFRPEADTTQWTINPIDGYLYHPSGGGNIFLAPVALPAGGQITGICLYARDNGAGELVAMQLRASRLAPAGQPVGTEIIHSVQSVYDGGYGLSCSDLPTPYTYRDTGDVDGDGQDEHLVHSLRVSITGGSAALGGVRVFWSRQASPQPATATFQDVPVGHPFHRWIEALSASGITGGCQTSPLLFCPDAPITRGQMAVFLAVALGLHWPS
jgi:hypothetical protein